MEKRVAMCCWLCDKIDENPDFLDNLWFSDEANFLFSGYVNTKNNTFWVSIPPEGCLQLPLHSIKCTPWVAISNMESLGHTGSIVNVHSWSTLSTTLKCYRSFKQHCDNEETLRMVNGFSRMVLPLTLQMKLCNDSDNVLEIPSSVRGVK